MSRRRRSRDKEREASTFANDLERLYLSPVVAPNPIQSHSHYADFEVEDRRTHHPLQENRPALTFDGTPANYVTDPNTNRSNKTKPFTRPPRVSSNPLSVFREPARQILVCVRRNRRKEILHAFKQTGRGKGHKRARKTWLSNIKCK